MDEGAKEEDIVAEKEPTSAASSGASTGVVGLVASLGSMVGLGSKAAEPQDDGSEAKELKLLQDYFLKFKALDKYTRTYDEEHCHSLLRHAKSHSRTFVSLRHMCHVLHLIFPQKIHVPQQEELEQSLETEYTMLLKKHEDELEMLNSYRAKLRALRLPSWTSLTDEYIHNIICHAKHHSNNANETQENLETTYQQHKKKHKKLARKEKLQSAMMVVYTDLRREWKMSMEEAKEYLQEQCQQKKYYLEDHPQELIGMDVFRDLIFQHDSYLSLILLFFLFDLFLSFFVEPTSNVKKHK